MAMVTTILVLRTINMVAMITITMTTMVMTTTVPITRRTMVPLVVTDQTMIHPLLATQPTINMVIEVPTRLYNEDSYGPTKTYTLIRLPIVIILVVVKITATPMVIIPTALERRMMPLRAHMVIISLVSAMNLI
jgi:hypothetical protein